MNFAPIGNIAMTLLCLAVLFQSVRLMRALKIVKDGGLARTIEALDLSTQQARAVLSELKLALGGCMATSSIVSEGKDIADELGVMIGIANASADRLMETSSGANRSSLILPTDDTQPELALAA